MNSIMETVRDVCNRVRTNSKHGTNFHNLLVILRREFKRSELDVKVKSERNKQLLDEEFYINAYYDAEDDDTYETPIEVVVHHNFDKAMVWDRKHVTSFLVQVFDATVHEYKHQRQSRKRGHENFWDHPNGAYHYQEYLMDPDEVDAYSLSIAIELCRSLGKYRALRYMSKFTALSKLKFQDTFVSPNLSAYIGQFGNTSTPVIKLLAKKVYVRLQKIDTDCIFV